MCEIKASVLVVALLIFVMLQIFIFLQPSEFKFLPGDQDHFANPQFKNKHTMIVGHPITGHQHQHTHVNVLKHANVSHVKNTTSIIIEPLHQGGAFDVCNTFNFVPANWTLFRKAPYSTKTETKQCQKLHGSLFKNNRVKQVVYPNKTVQNLGCTQKTKMCDESAYYDTERKVRINTPPCCMKHTKHVLKVITSDFKKLKISHMLFGGAVLGWSRNKHLVPYDNDQDIWMDGNYWNTPIFKKLVKNWTRIHGFKTQYKDGGYKLWVLYSSTNANGLDIYPWYVSGGWVKYPRVFGGRYDKPYSMIFPLKSVHIDGIDTYMPNSPEKYCEYLYGKGWRNEMTCTKVKRKKCVV